MHAETRFPGAAAVRERAAAQVVSAAELAAALADGEELALLDVRDERAYADGHLLRAVSVPLSELELRLARLVPRPDVRVVVIDGGGERAQRAARVLAERGYERVSVLAGDAAQWTAANLPVFTGMHVRSKAVGETTWGIDAVPAISARELDERRRQGDEVVVLDTRTPAEFEQYRIPGSVLAPGPEVVYRAHEIAPSADALVVVTCAGRTRGLVGAHSLIEAGLPNKVAWLEDGTTGWRFAGLTLESGALAPAPAASDAARSWAATAAARVAEQAGVETIDAYALARMRAERHIRTLYIFDVRSRSEYEEGHVADSVWVPAGQLAQELDAHVGVRGARIVLVDSPDAVRARFAATWLRRQGERDVHVAPDLLASEALAAGEEPAADAGPPAHTYALEPRALHELIEALEVAVIDVASSRAYLAGHIPGAWFAVRARLPEERPALPPAPRYVVTSPDGRLAALAATDLGELTSAPLAVLRGGTDAWRAAGLPLEREREHLLSTTDDVWGPDINDDDELRSFFGEYRIWCEGIAAEIEHGGGWS